MYAVRRSVGVGFDRVNVVEANEDGDEDIARDVEFGGLMLKSGRMAGELMFVNIVGWVTALRVWRSVNLFEDRNGAVISSNLRVRMCGATGEC